MCGLACTCFHVHGAYGEARNLGIRTRRGPCVASSRACRTDKGWDLTAALPVQGKKRGRAGHGQDQAGVQYTSMRHLLRRDKRGHLHQPDDAEQASIGRVHGDSIASASVLSPLRRPPCRPPCRHRGKNSSVLKPPVPPAVSDAPPPHSIYRLPPFIFICSFACTSYRNPTR